MKQAFYLLLATVVLASCGGGAFKKSEKGTQYKIIYKGSGDTMQYGNFFEFTYEMRYQNKGVDSLMNSSAQASNSIAILDTMSTPPYIYRIFRQCRKGDSVVLKVSVDSAYPANSYPEGIKKGGYFFSTYRIVNVYTDKKQADSVYAQLRTIAQQKMVAKEKELLAKDGKTIEEYLAKNKIVAEKAPAGTYVQIITPGTGPKIDTSVEARINYTGRTLNGTKAFDSNTDSAFRHVEPYGVKMWAPEVVRGWVDGLGLLSKGAKAKFYIPSSLGYGAQGNGGEIKPNDILVFDIEVVDLLTKAQSMALQKEEEKKYELQRKQMMEMQKRFQDSLANAAKKDSAAKKGK